MVKKVKIVAIHPDDISFFEKINPKIVGSVVTLHLSENNTFKGWETSIADNSLMGMGKSDLSGFAIPRFRYEEVS